MRCYFIISSVGCEPDNT